LRRQVTSGFTLIELAIVLAIISILISMIMFNIQARIDASKIFVTKERMQMIADSLDRYVEIYGKLPCPRSARTLREDSTYGYADQNHCDSGASGDIEIGDVPFKSLGLEAQTVADGWGTRFDYVISRDYAEEGKLTTLVEQNFLIINNASGGPGDSSIAYIIVSHGTDTFGGYIDKTANQIDPNSSGATDADKENSNGDKVFIQSVMGKDDDDIVIYKPTWQLPLYINGDGVWGQSSE
jgi:prepilin-type N-terminal cleavage/methylation domain-containing protein